MKTIGVIGGMSWESTASYYQLLNQGVRDSLGGLNSAKIIMHSINLDETHTLQYANKWNEIGEFLLKHAKAIETAGADFLLITTNTMHKVAPFIQENISIPLIHIAQATSDALNAKNCKKSILLGTRFTMSEDFNKIVYAKNDIEIIVPDKTNIDLINDIIFDELAVGKILKTSRQKLITIINDLCEKDSQIDSVILGCTEIGLLIQDDDVAIEVFDTTPIHVNKALQLSL